MGTDAEGGKVTRPEAQLFPTGESGRVGSRFTAVLAVYDLNMF